MVAHGHGHIIHAMTSCIVSTAACETSLWGPGAVRVSPCRIAYGGRSRRTQDGDSAASPLSPVPDWIAESVGGAVSYQNLG